MATTLLAFAFLTSCKDDDGGETAEQMNTRMLSKTWTVDDASVSDTDYDYSGSVTVTFNSDMTFSVTNSSVLPQLASPQREIPASGTWMFEGSDFKRVTLTSSGSTATFTITELTDSDLTVTYDAAEPKETNLGTATIELSSN
jgi:hypothetical protein